jgi:hypothetical protein
MEKKIIAREYISTTRCDLLEDGGWKAVNQVHDRVLREGETEWVDEMIEAMSMDTSVDDAIKTAMNSVLAYIVQNVYQNGFQSLVEYREYKRKLEEGKKALSDSEAQSI